MWRLFRKRRRVSPEASAALTERCVCCGRLTKVPVACPVQERDCYVSGCGQLCPACALRLRGDQRRIRRTGQL